MVDFDIKLMKYFAWSLKTFGPGMRTVGICKHIEKEMREIQEKPDDLTEWVDVAILAMDGYCRAGGEAERFLEMVVAKHERNYARIWPRPGPEDEATEHIRGIE